MKYSEALTKLKTAKEWNDYYYKKYGSFRTQLFLGRPNPWKNYTPKDYPKQQDDFPNHRERFVDELVIDVDGKQPDSTTHAYPVFQRVKDRGLECSLWASGGDGYHLHAFFPELRSMHPEDRKLIIESFKKVVLQGLIRPAGLDSHICGGKPLLYQVERGRHRKGGRKVLKAKHITNVKNLIPKDVWQHYTITKRKQEREAKKYAGLTSKILKGESPAFIKYFESENYYNLNDGKKRAAFIIASHYGIKEPTKQYIVSKLREWNSYTLRNGLGEQVLQSTADSVMKYHASGGIRAPIKYARDLLEELGRFDVWEATLLEDTQNDGIGGNN